MLIQVQDASQCNQQMGFKRNNGFGGVGDVGREVHYWGPMEGLFEGQAQTLLAWLKEYACDIMRRELKSLVKLSRSMNMMGKKL